MEEKSPSVHPTKHRRVLTAARRHVEREAQKPSAVSDDDVSCVGWLEQDGFVGFRLGPFLAQMRSLVLIRLTCMAGTLARRDTGSNRRVT